MLRQLYANDQTLWRLPLTGTGSWAVFFPLRPPDGAVAPPWGPASVAADAPEAPRPPAASESVPIPGTPFQLCYRSDRVPGMKALSQLDVILSGSAVPKGLKRIDLEVHVAGVRRMESFPPEPNRKTVFRWDGLDVYGRPVAGRRPATVRVGYVYDAQPPVPEECVLWREQRVMLGGWDARAGPRRLDPQRPPRLRPDRPHPIPGRRRAARGGETAAGDNDGRRRHGRAGLQQRRRPAGGLGQPERAARLAVGPDGSLYIADARQHRIRRVKPDGLIVTAAGVGNPGYDREEGPALETELNGPTGLAFGPDGSLYVADDGNDRVRRRLPGGRMRVIAGRGGRLAYGGDGGPALAAQMSLLRGLAVGPDGDVYVAQNGTEQCVRRISPDGQVTCLIGGPAGKAPLRTASAVAAAPDGTVFVADGDGCRVWRIDGDGSATVAAGTGAPASAATAARP